MPRASRRQQAALVWGRAPLPPPRAADLASARSTPASTSVVCESPMSASTLLQCEQAAALCPSGGSLWSGLLVFHSAGATFQTKSPLPTLLGTATPWSITVRAVALPEIWYRFAMVYVGSRYSSGASASPPTASD